MGRIAGWLGSVKALPVLLLLLAGCGPIYETQYHFQPPGDPMGRQLVAQCRVNQNMCKQNCNMREDSCRHEAERRGREEYRAYVRQREREKQPIKRSPESFVSYYQCSADRCESYCDEQYRGCYVESGGRVTSRQVCTAFCEKQTPAPALAPAPGGGPALSSVPPPAAPSSGGGLCRPGNAVNVLWEGEWYPARVRGPLSDGLCPVHYDGYGSEDDESVAPSRMRAR